MAHSRMLPTDHAGRTRAHDARPAPLTWCLDALLTPSRSRPLWANVLLAWGLWSGYSAGLPLCARAPIFLG